MDGKEKLTALLGKLKELPVSDKAKQLWAKLEPKGLKGYAIRTALLNIVCLVLAVFICYFFLSKGMTVVALCILVIGAGLIVLSNIMFAMDMREPIVALTDLAKRISDGGYGLQATKQGEDEIGELTDAINHMSARICEYEKVQSEFISSVSHELRTPLTAITGWSETMLFDENIAGDSRRGLEIIGRETGRADGLSHVVLQNGVALEQEAHHTHGQNSGGDGGGDGHTDAQAQIGIRTAEHDREDRAEDHREEGELGDDLFRRDKRLKFLVFHD